MRHFNKKIESIFINGEWRDAASGEITTIYNPATLEELTNVSYGDQTEAIHAIQSAKQAFPLWSSKTPRERSTILYKAHQLMLENMDLLAETLTLEQGKPIKEAKGEVASAASFLLWYAEEANRLYGEWIPSSVPTKRLLVIPQPVGVVGAITPWNFPSSMITRKIAPALAAGCTVVLKPASETPLSAIEIIKILEQAGVPSGVVNLVTGNSKEIGKSMLNSKDVRLITFTGSTDVGKFLMQESANHVKKLSLELGGHAPIIVFEDADLELATDLTLASKFRNSGQTCICANRVYVQNSIMEAFTKRLLEKVKELKPGNGVSKHTDIGPLINKSAIAKVQNHIDDARTKGANILCGGKEWQSRLNGFFYTPTILTKVNDDMLVMNEETFGPVIPLLPFDSEETAITRANDTEYGLAAYVFTENLNRSIRVSEKLEYGIIGVNDVFPAVAEAPFGGIKQSGIGKEGGHQGIHEFVNMKYVSTGIKI